MENSGSLLLQPSIREPQTPRSSPETSTGSQLSVPQFLPLQSPHRVVSPLEQPQKGSGCFQTFPFHSLKGKGQLGGRARAPRWCGRREETQQVRQKQPALGTCPRIHQLALAPWKGPEMGTQTLCSSSVPALHRLQHPQSS